MRRKLSPVWFINAWYVLKKVSKLSTGLPKLPIHLNFEYTFFSSGSDVFNSVEKEIRKSSFLIK